MHQIRLLFYKTNSAAAAGTNIGSLSTLWHPKYKQIMNMNQLEALELKRQTEIDELKEVNAELILKVENMVFVKELTAEEEKALVARNEQEMAIRQVIKEFELKVSIQQHEKNKGKRFGNSKENCWIAARPMQLATISPDGLTATNNKDFRVTVYAKEGFVISGENLRKEMDNFTGIILYYFEITRTSSKGILNVGFSDGSIRDGTRIGAIDGTYGLPDAHRVCWLSGRTIKFESEQRVADIGIGLTLGCGLLMDFEDNLTIFFTRNGCLYGDQFVIVPSVECLSPTVTLWPNASVEANFGNDLGNKPFQYDIDKCEGLIFP